MGQIGRGTMRRLRKQEWDEIKAEVKKALRKPQKWESRQSFLTFG